MKAPIDGKYLTRSEDTPSGWALRGAGIRDDLAVRLMECLCQLEFPDMVFAVGDGNALRDEWLNELQQWHQQQLDNTIWPRDDDMERCWAWLWDAKRRGKPRAPFNLTAEPIGSSAWLIAAELVQKPMPATRRHSKQKK